MLNLTSQTMNKRMCSVIRNPRMMLGSRVILAVFFLLPLVGLTQEVSITPAPAFSKNELTKLPTSNWLTNGGDLYNRRYSPLTQINHDNVGKLKGVWRTHLDGSGIGSKYSGEAQPIVYAGVLYIVTGADDVFAISVETGEKLWTYKAELDPNISTICCGWTSRGVGLGEGKVYLGQLDGRLVALDQQDGEVVWSIQAESWEEGYSITSAPLYYDGLVITGFAGAEYATRGRVKAYDADDGSLVWTFYTVPGPGELGHDSWPQDNEVWRFGGATVWQTPAVDPDLGLLYFSTANPGPDFNGAVRAGDNLFSASIVAVDVATGKYNWHYQQIHHDLWDFDSANPVVLFDLELDGELRKAVAEVNKNGWVYILDRITGKPLIGIDEHPVPQDHRQATAATQPIPIGDPVSPLTIDVPPEGYTLTHEEHVYVPFWTERVVGKRGGANWPPSSYAPPTQTLYVCASERLSFYETNPDATEMPEAGERYMEGRFGGVASLSTTGILAAMDMNTNRVLWNQRWADRCYSGSAVTAGGLLFIGRSDGRFMAFDAASGMPLWEFQTGAGVNAPPSVFEHDGQQYIAVYSAGNLFAGSTRGDSVWLFSLNGTLGPVNAPVPTRSSGRGGRGVVGNVNAGRMLYAQACLPCHGVDGQGGHGAGAALTVPQDLTAVIQVVTEGANEMPPFGNQLTIEQIRDVSTYLVEELLLSEL